MIIDLIVYQKLKKLIISGRVDNTSESDVSRCRGCEVNCMHELHLKLKRDDDNTLRSFLSKYLCIQFTLFSSHLVSSTHTNQFISQ